MIYLYLFGFAAVVVFFMWLGCRWEPDPTARLMAEDARQSHPSMRAHRAAVKAAEDALFAGITADLAAEFKERDKAIVREMGPPPGWDDIRRIIPEQATDYEGDQ